MTNCYNCIQLLALVLLPSVLASINCLESQPAANPTFTHLAQVYYIPTKYHIQTDMHFAFSFPKPNLSSTCYRSFVHSLLPSPIIILHLYKYIAFTTAGDICANTRSTIPKIKLLDQQRSGCTLCTSLFTTPTVLSFPLCSKTD